MSSTRLNTNLERTTGELPLLGIIYVISLSIDVYTSARQQLLDAKYGKHLASDFSGGQD